MVFTSIPFVFMIFPSCYLLLHPLVVKIDKNIESIELGVVWEVMELNLGVATNPYSTPSLQKCIIEGERSMGGGFKFFIIILEELGLSFSPPLP